MEGLDQLSRERVLQLLTEQQAAGLAMLWVANRLDEIPSWITHLAFMHDAELLCQGHKDDVLARPEVQGLMHFNRPLGDFPAAPNAYTLPADQPLVRMVNTRIRYDERVLFSDLNWEIKPGCHWAIQGAEWLR